MYTKENLAELRDYLISNGATRQDAYFLFNKNIIIYKHCLKLKKGMSEVSPFCIGFNMERETGYTEEYLTFKEIILCLNAPITELPLYINYHDTPIHLIITWRLKKGI
jgi:hypothetical protein